MAKSGKFSSIRGMYDILPTQTSLWQETEALLIDIFSRYGYREIRLPILEKTDLFLCSVGTHTDIVSKEMYSFVDQGGDHLTMRPEGTASCVRAGLQNSLITGGQQNRLWYAGPMFRHERPQHGRSRQFAQLGVETFGFPGPDIDFEILSLTSDCWQALGISDVLTLEINTLGNHRERANYHKVLVNWLKDRDAELDPDSRARIDSNPLRIFDSKSPHTQELLKEAPMLSTFLEEDSIQHFEHLKDLLTTLAIPFKVNPKIVRGLDYYSHTVFEWTTETLGAQGTVCAGGRYDGLVESLGGAPTPGMGMALGLDRVMNILFQDSQTNPENESFADLYLVPMSTEQHPYCLLLASKLRRKLAKLRIVCHCGGGRIKSRMTKADKSGARFALIVGEYELETGKITIKSLRDKNSPNPENQNTQITIDATEAENYLSSAFNI